MEKVYISGSSSFIGKYVQKELLEIGYEVEELSRSFVDNPDQSEFGTKCLEGSILLYFGWQSNRDSNYQLDTANFLWLEKATKAVEFARKKEMKIVIPGSSAEYLPLNEFPYVQSKRKLLERLRAIDVDYLWPRIFYAFSPSELRPSVMRQAYEKHVSNHTLILRSYDDVQDYIEVRDVASQITKALQIHLSGEIDIGTGKSHKSQDLVRKSFPELSIDFNEDISTSRELKEAVLAKVDTRLFDYKNSHTFRYFEG